MRKQIWNEVDQYFAKFLAPEAENLSWVLDANLTADLPAIDVSPLQGKLLNLLVRIHGSKRVLEIGTLGGYSTIWIARALPPSGQVVTLELETKHARVAEKNLATANMDDKVELIVGPALESLNQLVENGCQPFDLVFVDADKPNNPNYFAWALKLTVPGSVIIFDNVVREGDVIDADSDDPRVQGVRQLNERMHACDKIDATAIQTVGIKGHDGFTIGLVTD